MSTHGTMYMPRVELLKSFGRGYIPQIWRYEEKKGANRCAEASRIFILPLFRKIIDQ
jgi:hypothetical protein